MLSSPHTFAGYQGSKYTENVRTSFKSGKFSYISKFHILISYKLTIYIVMCFYQGTN